MNESVYERTGINTFTFDPFPNPLEVYLGPHFLLNLFLIGRQLLYDAVLISAIHQDESVTGTRMSPHPEPPSQNFSLTVLQGYAIC